MDGEDSERTTKETQKPIEIDQPITVVESKIVF